MTEAERDRFDAIVGRVVDGLPAPARDMLDEVPLIILDEPTPAMLRDLGLMPHEADELCGLHTGRSITERSVEHSAELPADIHLFRRGILALVGGWGDEALVEEEIRITVLHELGHAFGLDEDQLGELGYD